MIRLLVLVHRWLGIAFCLLFAMWFSTGIVMHFWPFPALTEAERLAGLAPIDVAQVAVSPGEAVLASGIAATRVRLLQRPDGPVYLVSAPGAYSALHADDLTSAALRSGVLALAVGLDHARRRGLMSAPEGEVEMISYDQWSMSAALDRHRPLYRIMLKDEAGTGLYVSSTTGEVVLDTTCAERTWNYLGSVAHWIYPTVLRSSPAAWHAVVWWVSLGALACALAGACLGLIRIRSPYRGWHAWHHVLGVTSMTFVLTWTFSGWLSLDDGRLFSTGRISEAEARILAGAPDWRALPVSPQAGDVEWFALDGQIFRRGREFLSPDDLRRATSRLSPTCSFPAIVDAQDAYAIAPVTPGAPLYRVVCGEVWYHVDGGNGALIEKLDGSRRSHRWLYRALHTLDIPALAARPWLRTALIMGFCGLGLAFTFTAMVIGWRRLRCQFGSGF